MPYRKRPAGYCSEKGARSLALMRRATFTRHRKPTSKLTRKRLSIPTAKRAMAAFRSWAISTLTPKGQPRHRKPTKKARRATGCCGQSGVRGRLHSGVTSRPLFAKFPTFAPTAKPRLMQRKYASVCLPFGGSLNAACGPKRVLVLDSVSSVSNPLGQLSRIKA